MRLDKLLNKCEVSIEIKGPVTVKMAQDLWREFLRLRKNPPKNILFMIDSQGGDVMAMERMVYTMSKMAEHSQIITLAVGDVASAASILFIVGDKRYILPHAQFCLHQVRYNMPDGQVFEKHMRELKVLKKDNKKFKGLLISGRPFKKSEVEAFDRGEDIEFNGVRAAKLGFGGLID